jgi:hypothetical protein
MTLERREKVFFNNLLMALKLLSKWTISLLYPNGWIGLSSGQIRSTTV